MSQKNPPFYCFLSISQSNLKKNTFTTVVRYQFPHVFERFKYHLFFLPLHPPNKKQKFKNYNTKKNLNQKIKRKKFPSRDYADHVHNTTHKFYFN